VTIYYVSCIINKNTMHKICIKWLSKQMILKDEVVAIPFFIWQSPW
jgi:hypothetical protein